MSTKQSFEPLASPEVEVLILGSIPGDRSIELQQYYGHPQNRFWRLLAAITDSPTPRNYDEKKALLAQNHIALWDVAHRAERVGSLDSAIRNEAPNDIATFVAQHPKVGTIAFNGQKAEQLYNKYFDRLSSIKYLSLPSTSPANAAWSLEKLQEKWTQIVSR